MLDDATCEQIQDRLIDEIASTEQRIIDLEVSSAPIAPDKGLGRLTRMEAIQDKSVNEAALAQARQTLNALELALTKVWDAEFGVCVSCRQPIPVERLVALPSSTQCTPCAARR